MPRSGRVPSWDDRFDDRRPRRKARRRRGSGGPPAGAVIGIVVAVVAVLGVAVFFLTNRRPAVEPNADGQVQFFFGEPNVAEDRGDWQRLTPADHVVAAMAPGRPEALNDNRLWTFEKWGQKATGWAAKGSARTEYFVLQVPIDVRMRKPLTDIFTVAHPMTFFLGLGGMATPTGEVEMDGLGCQHFEPDRRAGIAGVFSYRAVEHRNFIHVFGVSGRPNDATTKRFYDSIRFAKGN